MTQTALRTFRFVRLALMAGVGFPFILASNAFAQLPAPAVPAEPGAAAPSTAEVERVVVTGSNIPTAEETGPNPVDTYRPQDIEKLGIRNATDLQTYIPQQAGGTVNLNIGDGGDGTVQFNLRGLLPKETLILIDGKRVAYGSLAVSGFTGGPDINLIPFSMIDHVDILKDGASAVYGSDAIAGVVNFFLIHKFRGLEIGGTYGNTNMGASNEMGEWEAWIKAGTGDDKTDIVVIADFWERTGGIFSRDRNLSSDGNFIRFGGFDSRSLNVPGHVGDFALRPGMFFGRGGRPQPGVNTPLPHSSTGPATSPFYTDPARFNIGFFGDPKTLDGTYLEFNFAAFTPALPPADRQVYYGSFVRDICDKYLTVFGDFKVSRSFFDASLAAVPFEPDPFHIPVPTSDSVRSASVCRSATRLIRSRSQMRLLRTSFLTDLVSLCLPGLGFGRLTTPGPEVKSSPITISCSMSACAAKWDGLPTTSKPGTGKPVSVTLATRAKIYRLVRSASPVCGRRCWIRIRLRRLIPS